MKLTVLVEDTKKRGFKHEHGLSVHIQKGKNSYLLDVGQTGKYIKNAKKLGIDLKQVKALFISHNHYDHIGGLRTFFAINKTAKVYLKKEAKQQVYAKGFGSIIPVGGKAWVQKNFADRLVYIDSDVVVDGLHLLTDSTGDKAYFCQDKRLLKKTVAGYVLDDFAHELFVAFLEKGKVHVLSSCSHRGIVNILNTVKAKFSEPIGYVFAGLHMSKNRGKDINCTSAYLEDVADEISKHNAKKIYTCHCTGFNAYFRLKEIMGDKIAYSYVGETIEI